MDWNATTFGQKAESVPPALSRSAADEIDVSLHLFIYGFCPNSIIYLASWSSNLPTVPAKSGGTMGAMRNLWIRWKMLRLPWRKTFLIGKEAPPPLQRGICISVSFRPRPPGKYFLGVQGYDEYKSGPANGTIQSQDSLLGCQDFSSVAPMAAADTLRPSNHTRATS